MRRMRPIAILLVTAALLCPGLARATPPGPGDAPPPAPPAEGWLTVACQPECDSVWEADRYLGPGWLARRPMAPGVHEITLTRGKVGGQVEMRTITVTIEPGKGTEVSPDDPAAMSRSGAGAPPVEPPPGIRSKGMLVAGLVAGAAGIALVAGGGALVAEGHAQAQAAGTCDSENDSCGLAGFGPTVGGGVMIAGGSLVLLAGFALAITGGGPPQGPAVSWSVAPLALPPLGGRAPAGLAVVGTF